MNPELPTEKQGKGGMTMRAEGQIARGGVQREPTVEGPPSESQTEQYSLAKILGIWAAAALPMGALAWVVAPLVAGRLAGPVPLARALLMVLTVGLIWQFVLVMVLVYRERGSLRWSVLKDALWLRSPRSPKTGRVGGRLWLVLIPALLIFWVQDFIPDPFPPVASHDMATFVQSAAGMEFLSGNWVWYAVIIALSLFNTVLGEELLFRGLLLPRMRGVFGRGDFVANGVLFAFYHLHMPWVIPATLLDIFALSYPSRRYRSALIGIAVHSAQSVVVLALILPLVLQ
jgi:membrane protease YdiL (CAAX protease family)